MYIYTHTHPHIYIYIQIMCIYMYTDYVYIYVYIYIHIIHLYIIFLFSMWRLCSIILTLCSGHPVALKPVHECYQHVRSLRLCQRLWIAYKNQIILYTSGSTARIDSKTFNKPKPWLSGWTRALYFFSLVQVELQGHNGSCGKSCIELSGFLVFPSSASKTYCHSCDICGI